MQLVKTGVNIDFVGKRGKAGVFSGLLVLTSFLLMFFVGPNWGIDFTGGSEILMKFDDSVEISEIRSAVVELGMAGDSVQQVNADEDNEFVVRVRDTTFAVSELEGRVESAIGEAFGPDWILSYSTEAQVGARMTIEHGLPRRTAAEINAVLPQALIDSGVVAENSQDTGVFYMRLPTIERQVQEAISTALAGHDFVVQKVDSVGPKVGGQLRKQGFQAMFFTILLVLVYIGFRFDLGFAPGAIIALVHDVSITMGIFIVIQQEVNLSMIGALLTIIGYSLNDTIVIYDRIRENMSKYRRTELPKLINDSINETLNRTVATSLTTMAALMAFLFIGGPVIQTFALAMMIGVVVGTYSTVFVATPMILVMEKLKPAIGRLLVPSDKAGESIKGTSEAQERSRAANNRRFIVLAFLGAGFSMALATRSAISAFMVALGHVDSVMWGLGPQSSIGSIAIGSLTFFLLMRHKRAVAFTDETITELARTSWPDREETMHSSNVVIWGTLFVALSLSVFDFVWKRVANLVLFTG